MRRHDRGDTLIEVLLAVTIFSMVAVGTLSIMSQGTNAAQRAIEITLVRQQIDSQVEALRAAHQAAASERTIAGTDWQSITAGVGTLTSYDASSVCPTVFTDLNAKHFIIDPTTAEKVSRSRYNPAGGEPTVPPFAQILKDDAGRVSSYGIWIEPSFTPNSDPSVPIPGQYSFRVRACWSAAGLLTPMKLETVVRLYEI